MTGKGWMLVLLSVLFAAPAMALDCDTEKVLPELSFPMVELHTSKGKIVVELDRRRAPIAVNNFLRYADGGHYDGTIFHRVVPEFVMQGGGYKPDFSEKPTCDPVFNESGNGLANDKYSIAMARYTDPHTARAQFYINLTDNDNLNPNPKRWGYTVFGRVIEGYEVVDGFNAVTTGYAEQLDSSEVPTETITLDKVVVQQ